MAVAIRGSVVTSQLRNGRIAGIGRLARAQSIKTIDAGNQIVTGRGALISRVDRFGGLSPRKPSDTGNAPVLDCDVSPVPGIAAAINNARVCY